MPKNNTIAKTLFIALIVSCLCFCKKNEAPAYSAVKSVIADSAMVVSPHPLASQIGVDVLKDGGNAADAMIAVQFAIAVVYPRAGNIGGGGFLVYRAATGETATLDYREKAPAAATRDMYLDSLGNPVSGLSVAGHLAAGVPGTVDGLLNAHARLGKLPLAQLINPAIKLAADGYRLSKNEAERLNEYQDQFLKFNDPGCPFIRNQWKEGDLLRQPELAATLTRIRDNGRAGFYAGKTADYIVSEMTDGNGIITAADLTAYQSKWRDPIIGHYKEYKLISMAPPSSGGVALVEMLEMLEPHPIAQWGFQQPETTHLMVEAMRRAYADRAEHLGDSDFYPVPVDSLLNLDYIAARMSDFNPDSASTSESSKAHPFILAKESFETTHTSIVDAAGNACAVTTTLNGNFGCKVWVDGAGFFLNNEMDDFSVKPGVPNVYGLVGAEANSIAAGKRMLSSMTPTIVEKNGAWYMVLGTPGGSTIITSVLQVFLNVVEFDQPLDQAVNAPRFHHQWLPDEIMAEPGAMNQATRQTLTAKGHSIREVEAIAVVKAIVRTKDGKIHGAGDPRDPDDDARGY